MSAGNQLYFIALVPPMELQEQVNGIKHEFSLRFNSKHALKSPPHITLIPPFKWDQQNEPQLSQYIEKSISNIRPFHVLIDGFGAFPSRVIFLKIELNEDLKYLQKTLMQELDTQMNIIKIARMGKTFKPHMTVAFRDLKQDKFQLAWKEYGSKPFRERFWVSGVSVLKHFGGKWHIISHYNLSGG